MQHNVDVAEDAERCAMDTNESASASVDKMATQHLIIEIAKHIFSDYLKNTDINPGKSWMTDGSLSTFHFKSLWRTICKQLEKEAKNFKRVPSENQSYRIGSATVTFQRKYVGSFDFKDNDLKICSKDNFSTISANTCVFKGKWQYELMLGSKGVMQIGWATVKCQFSHENGVGDTPDSYAYDGNRQRKWNVSTHKYGEMWHCGDIISCTIDLDKGEISYFRNGRPLGVAFDNVRTGPEMAYFPAFSLALDESLLVNFGETPFSYPQEGFAPLQEPPTEHVLIARRCLNWLLRLVTLSFNLKEHRDYATFEGQRQDNKRMPVLIIAQYIGTLLAPLMAYPYIIDDVFLPTLKELSTPIYEGANGPVNTRALEFAHTFLKILMSTLQEEELKKALSNLVMSLQRRFRHIPQNVSYDQQKESLTLLHLILSEPTIRKFCLRHILFEKDSHYRFISFVCVKCIDKVQFKSIADINFWSSKNGSFKNGDERKFYSTVRALESAFKEIEELQISVLKLLVISDDAVQYNETSRGLFLAKFRQFIRDQLVGSRLSVIPSAVVLSLFHCYLLLFLRLWEEEMEEDLGPYTVPPSLFYDGKIDYFDTQRLGGLESHLKKKFALERDQALKDYKESKLSNPIESSKHCAGGIENMDDCLPSTSGTVLGEMLLTDVENVKEKLQRVNMTEMDLSKQQRRSKEELRTSLIHLLDGVLLLYHHGGYTQIENIVAQSDVYFSNVSYLEELIKKKRKYLAEQENRSHSVLNELNRSIAVLQSKLKEQSYQHAWNLATIISSKYLRRILIIVRIVLGALNSASKQGGLFTFVPDFYVETLTQLCQDLKHLILCDQETIRSEVKKLALYHPGGVPLSKELSESYQDLLRDVGEFLALHFSDSRIVNADSKDSLIQALAGFVCHRPGLEALEKMPLESRMEMVKSLLQPYDNRAWAQNNWILVRFWKGKGFGFRFSKSPHLTNKLGPKPANCEIPNTNLSLAPYYSEVFLSHVSEVLLKTEISTPFLNSLLNQLNWVFSEFIGMLQEIQNASNRPERVFIDSRQLRICATCFDLALALLRVLEMIVSVSRNIFLDQQRQDSKPLLTRLCQLLCQVLNRVSISSGCFSYVVNLEIPGLETIHYYPFLTSVVGIICELLKDDVYYSKGGLSDQAATKTFLDEASFQMSSLYSLLGGKEALKPRTKPMEEASALPTTDTDCAPISIFEPNEMNTKSTTHLFVDYECECKHPRFCLRKYPNDILAFEIHKVIDVIHHLKEASAIREQQSICEDADSLCTICYASNSDAVFDPCSHTSCSTCITHYLMNRAVCFFCKANICRVKDSSGKVIYTSPSTKENCS